MRQGPPENLVSLLEKLRLASPGQVAAAERRARRLARGLPLFESVWVDALTQSRLLTPFQAAEIHAGRGEDLLVGSQVLLRASAGLGYADVYQARHLETGEVRRLAVVSLSPDRLAASAARLERLVAASADLPRETLAPVEASGVDGRRLWAACSAPFGLSAADALVHRGRFPAAAVLWIAQEMTAALAALHSSGLCHGDLRAATLHFDQDERLARKDVRLRLPFPGLREAVRPREDREGGDLPPEAFDGLAPERLRDSSPPSAGADVYACGCLWWHLLTGRDPLPGGDGPTKLRTIEKGNIGDPRLLAPDAPETLVKAILACTRPSPDDRPSDLADLAAMLGEPTPAGQAGLRSFLSEGLARSSSRQNAMQNTGDRRQTKLWIGLGAVSTLVVVFLTLIFWPSGRPEAPERPQGSVAATPTVKKTLDPGADDKTQLHNVATPIGQAVVPEFPAPFVPSPDKGSPSAAPRAANDATKTPGAQNDAAPSDLILQESSAEIANLALRPGQRVHGPPGRRAVVNVGGQGLPIDVPGVVFEKIDFVWTPESHRGADARRPAILRLQASSVTLRDCTFRSNGPEAVALVWEDRPDKTPSSLDLPSGRIVVERCVFRKPGAVVDCLARGALVLRFSNVLHLGGGPLVRLNHSPDADEPLAMSLTQTTLRESGPIVEFGPIDAGRLGRLSIETHACVFSPRVDQPLLSLSDKSPRDALAGRLIWTGQGSLVVPDCPIAARQDRTGQLDALAESGFSIDGLVRGEVTFAGEIDGPAANSRAARWLAPLPSNRPPGVDPAALAE